MNEIVKFTEYKTINENVIIPVVDAVISQSGTLNTKYNTSGLPLKGNVELYDRVVERIPKRKGLDKKGNEKTIYAHDRTEKDVDKIKGQDGNYYPGGLDKNGNLIGSNFDEDSNLLTVTILRDESGVSYVDRSPEQLSKETPIKIDPESRSRLSEKDQEVEYWNKKIDYIKCVPSTSTGWVNVKVDMEVIKRVRRYSAGLVEKDKVSDNSHSAFVRKLKSLDRISNSSVKVRNITQQAIQKQMSAIILLHYINEIKTFFTPSAAGLLFESFIGGLIPFAKVTEDNGKADITVPTDKGNIEYQVKLYNTSAQYIDIAVNRYDDASIHPNGEIPLDYYLICIKRSDEVVVYVLDNKPKSDGYYNKFRTGGETSKSKTFSVTALNDSSKLCVSNGTKFILSLTNLEERIKNLGDNLKDSLDSLYSLLSQFQYNLETIITGIDKDGKKVDEADFSIHSKNATANVKQMQIKLQDLINEVTRR